MADVGCPESVKPIRYDKRYDIMKLRGEDMKKNEVREAASGCDIKDLRGTPQLREAAARWFYEKWGIAEGVSEQEYLDSIDSSIKGDAPFPRWYVVVSRDGDIIAGAGVIDNDFHERKDLAPNICALYVEPEFRCHGIAGCLLEKICGDMKQDSIEAMYLVTDHTGFYERYGWEFMGMVKSEDGGNLRMYVRK